MIKKYLDCTIKYGLNSTKVEISVSIPATTLQSPRAEDHPFLLPPRAVFVFQGGAG